MEVSDSSGDDGLQNKKGQVTGNLSIKSNRDTVIITGSTVKREARGTGLQRAMEIYSMIFLGVR